MWKRIWNRKVAAGMYLAAAMCIAFFAIPPAYLDAHPLVRVALGAVSLLCFVGAAYEWWWRNDDGAAVIGAHGPVKIASESIQELARAVSAPRIESAKPAEVKPHGIERFLERERENWDRAADYVLGPWIPPAPAITRRPRLVLGYEPYRGHDGKTGIQWQLLEPLFVRNGGDADSLNITVSSTAFGDRAVTCSLSKSTIAPDDDPANLNLFCEGERFDEDLERAFAGLFKRRIEQGETERVIEQFTIRIAYVDHDMNQYSERYEVSGAVQQTAKGWQAEMVSVRLIDHA